MDTKLCYTFVQENDSIIFRSKVNSYGLDHITDKDLASFYYSFSRYAVMDTGLLPLDGTGLLSIRKAGDHTQVVYQHKPDLYYINWGKYEKDSSAEKYALAQPYRIVIIDFINNNLYGARTFYSPIPATHPDIPLYHVNLPNINCKGYRGNSVGWICLYQNQDWSHLPFNERLAKAVDRCSGTEAYNDVNMSETDGPRFYREYYEMIYPSSYTKFSYLWNPKEWQEKSSKEGFLWTLDQLLWIPVLVESMDSQAKHQLDGQNLTLKMAILGNYQVYYTDTHIPKPINAIQRNQFADGLKTITNWFTRSFVTATTTYTGTDVFSESAKARAQNVYNVYNIEPEEGSDGSDEDHVDDEDHENDDEEIDSNEEGPF